MSTYVKTKHDIGFLKQDGTTTVGLRLARDKNGNPIYRWYDDAYLVQQLSTSAPGYENLNPEKEFSILRNDWRGGFGQEYDDDEHRYYQSIGADLRFKNNAILSGLPVAITLPSLPSLSIVNADMELTTGWTSVAFGRTNADKHGGTYSWGGVGVNGTEYQDLATWDDRLRNTKWTFTCWVKSNIASSIQIHDGIGGTSAAHTGGGAWEQLSVTRTLSTTATSLRLNLISVGVATVYFDDAAITTTMVVAPCKAGCLFNSIQYFAMGAMLYKLNATGDGFTYVYSFPNVITDLEVFGANLYIAIGNSDAYWYMNTSEACTQSTLANNTMKYFAVLKGTTDNLYGSDTASTIRYTPNPVNGGTAWSDATTVDSSTYSICELISSGNILYIRKQDRPYYLDSTGAVKRLAEETEFMTNSTDGTRTGIFKDDLFMQWGSQGLLWWDTSSSILNWINPADYCTNLSTFTGSVFATTADERYLYAITDNSTKVEVLSGRYEDVEGSVAWRWHPLSEITLTGCQTAFVSAVYAKRLWITSTAQAEAIYYIPLTTQYGDITGDTNYRFGTGGYFDSSWLHLGFMADTKAYVKITLTQGSSTTANIYWQVQYQKLGDSVWTNIGNFTTTPTQTKYLPVDASSNKPKSTMMKFRFIGVTNDTTKTPVLLSYDIRGVLYPSNRRLIECEVLCGNDILLNDGIHEFAQAPVIKEAIDEARGASWPVTFYDIQWGATASTIYVKFLPTEGAITSKEKTPALPEGHIKLLLQQVTLS